MSRAQLERVEERVQQKWYDLVMAERSGASTQALERLYQAYMLAVEEYNRCLETRQRRQEQDAA